MYIQHWNNKKVRLIDHGFCSRYGIGVFSRARFSRSYAQMERHSTKRIVCATGGQTLIALVPPNCIGITRNCIGNRITFWCDRALRWTAYGRGGRALDWGNKDISWSNPEYSIWSNQTRSLNRDKCRGSGPSLIHKLANWCDRWLLLAKQPFPGILFSTS